MRGLVLYGTCFALAAALLITVMGTRPVSSDPGSSGDGGPSPTPEYADPFSSTIDVVYTRGGIPTAWFSGVRMAFVDGEFCSVLVPLPVSLSISQEVPWPWVSGHSSCSRIGAVVSLCLSPPDTCSEEFTFTGDDASVRIEVPVIDLPVIQAIFVDDDGAPATVQVTSVSFRLGSQVCLEPNVAVPVTTDTLLVDWGFLSEACQAPNVRLEAVLSTVDHGDLSATFVWEGEDVTTFDVVVPDIATATPSPSPPPTVSPTPTPSTAAVTASPTAAPSPTPAQLPVAGGPPPPERSAGREG